MQLGPHILLAAGGQLLDPAELLRRLRRQQGLVPKGTKSSAIVQLGTAVMAAQSAWPGALWHAWEWRVGGCGRAQGQGLGGRHARSTAALPTWPPMVAEWSGVAGVHVTAPARLLERPRVEI